MEEAKAAFREGSAHFGAGRLAEAARAFRRAIALDPREAATHFNLGTVLRRCGEPSEAAAAFLAAERLAPGHPKVMAALFDTIGDWVEAGGGFAFQPAAPGPRAAAAAVSIVACSIDEAKLAALRGHLAKALGARPHELVVIRDARSLAEGYNRGLGQCRHDLVAFMHDDVELVSPDPFGHVAAALDRCDVVGLVGTARLAGPSVGWAGHPHLHGCVVHPAVGQEGWHAWAYSLACGLVEPMQALDGMFFAARREVARAIGFDEATFDAFHFYDLDFSWRAHAAGHRVAVTTDVIAIHQSRGNYEGEAWQRGAARFRAKFPEAAGTRGANHAYAAWVRDREAVLRFYGTLRALAG